jgi:hypothetical protein
MRGSLPSSCKRTRATGSPHGPTGLRSIRERSNSCLYLPYNPSRIYMNIILPVVLYGREAGSLTLREEHRLRVFEGRVPRRTFVPKRDEVTEC